MAGGFWTDERVIKLTNLWSAGHSASAICVLMGAPSRNAVISKIHRIGLPTRLKIHPQITRRTPTRKPIEQHVGPKPFWRGATNNHFKPEPEPVVEQHDPLLDVAAKSLLELEAGDCRWPIGTPGDEGFGFCAKPRAMGTSYCKGHEDRAKPPLPPAKPRPESSPSKVREREDARDGRTQAIPAHGCGGRGHHGSTGGLPA